MLKKESDIDGLESFILNWNIDFPVDRWWRQKHSIAFNSAAHREVSFLDMYMEFYEDSLYQRMTAQSKRESENPYIPGMHDFLLEPKAMKTEMTDEEFEKVEI